MIEIWFKKNISFELHLKLKAMEFNCCSCMLNWMFICILLRFNNNNNNKKVVWLNLNLFWFCELEISSSNDTKCELYISQSNFL